MNHQRTIFLARVGPVQIAEKRIETCYAKLGFSYPVGSAGHVVHSCVSGVRNIDALFFLLGWDRYGFHKNALGYLMPNFCSCIRWYVRVT
jgi:hypothetical protein